MSAERSVSNRTATQEAAKLGAGFIRWGVGLFIFGLCIGYGPLLHYLHGALEEVGPAFLKNVTLWFGCPWTLATYTVQIGGLGMVAIGVALITFARDGHASALGSSERKSLGLCIFGLIAEFATGYAGYFVVNHFWPSFYYVPIQTGKNVWLVLQGASIAFYIAGVMFAFGAIRRASHLYVVNAGRTAA